MCNQFGYESVMILRVRDPRKSVIVVEAVRIDNIESLKKHDTTGDHQRATQNSPRLGIIEPVMHWRVNGKSLALLNVEHSISAFFHRGGWLKRLGG